MGGRTAIVKKYYLAVIGWLIVGLAILLVGFREHLRDQDTLRWPTVEGKIVSSELTDLSSFSGESTPERFSAHIVYSYSVGGVAYQSSTVGLTLASQSGSRDEEEQVAARYPKDLAVWVHYNPSDAADSVLEPGIDRGRMNLAVGFALIPAGIAALFYLRGLRRQREPRP